MPWRVWNDVRRLVTSSSGISILGRAHIERIAQTIAEKIEGKKREREKKARENEKPGIALLAFSAVIDERAPRTHGRMHAETEEAQKGFEQHHTGHNVRAVNNDDAEHVGNHVAQNDPPFAQAERNCGFYVFLLFARHHLAAHNARHVQP